MRKERIWITWEVGAELFEVISAAGGAARYLWCLTETLRLLMVHRPRILFVQSPSYVLAFMAGVLLADSEFRHALEADIEPFKGLLLGLSRLPADGRGREGHPP